MNPDFDELDDTILLNGISVSSVGESVPAEPSPGTPDPTHDDDRPVLTFRELDVPGRDYQPRLFRFGEAA